MADFFGHKIRERVGVVILAAEGAGTLSHRIAAAKRHAYIDELLPIAIIPAVPNLADDPGIRIMVEMLGLIAAEFRSRFEVRLGLVIIDTVAAAFVMVDENSNSEAARIVRSLHELATATGALIMPVHHYGKTDGNGLRGASAFQAGADVVISVVADREGNSARVKTRVLSLVKSRTGSEGPISGFDVINMTLGIDEDGEPFGAGYVVGNDRSVTQATGPTEPQSTIIFRAAFDAVHDTAGVDQPDNMASEGLRTVSYATIQSEYVKRYALAGRSSSAAPKAFTRCVANLQTEFSEITDAEGNRWICRRS